MPAPPSDARSFEATVARVERCGDDAVLLALRCERALDPVRASRFFMVKPLEREAPLITRPFSIYRQSGDEIELLIKVMGRGTRALAAMRTGERARVIGPLGNGWPALHGDDDVPWVMLAGGVGSAPFYLAIQQALAGMDGRTPARREQLAFLFGAATKGLLYDVDAFRRLGVAVHTATDDGSDGLRGNVVALLHDLWTRGALPEQVRLLACGPERMLEAVEHVARERGLEAWLSLETLMGCGVGICNGCPVPTRPDGPLGAWPNAKCCVEGPVFRADAIALAGA